LYRREEAQGPGGEFIVLAFWKSDLDSGRGQDTQYLRSWRLEISIGVARWVGIIYIVKISELFLATNIRISRPRLRSTIPKSIVYRGQIFE
jgi:hypothetical protein